MATTKVKLKELLIILRNGANIKQFEGAKGLPITRIETISDAIINPLKVGYANILDDKYQDYYLKEGDILLSHINSVTHLGKCAIYDNPTGKLIHGMNLLMLRANKELILPKYLYYVLNSKQFKVQLPKITKKSVNQASMTVADIGNLCLTIEENINQQQKIIDILDKADEIRKKKKQANEKLDEFLKSIFKEMFGTPYINENNFQNSTFKDICTVRQGLQIPISKRKTKPSSNRLKYITIQYLNGKKETEYIENPKENVICNKQDVLMTRTGNTGMVITDVSGVFHNNFFLIDFNKNILKKEFLVFYLKHPKVQAEIIKKAGTSTIPDLNHSDFYKIELFIPSVKSQNKFAQIVEKVEAQKQKNKIVIEQMNNLFNSLSQKAFKGDL